MSVILHELEVYHIYTSYIFFSGSNLLYKNQFIIKIIKEQIILLEFTRKNQRHTTLMKKVFELIWLFSWTFTNVMSVKQSLYKYVSNTISGSSFKVINMEQSDDIFVQINIYFKHILESRNNHSNNGSTQQIAYIHQHKVLHANYYIFAHIAYFGLDHSVIMYMIIRSHVQNFLKFTILFRALAEVYTLQNSDTQGQKHNLLQFRSQK